MTIRLPILPDPDEVGPIVWLQLVRTHAKMVRRIEQFLERHGLTLPQFDVLATLAAGENITQQQLAERLLVTKGNVCGLLDRMEAAELVERRPDAEDRRINRLFLTAKGRKTFARLMPEHTTLVNESLRLLSAQQQQHLYQLLDLIEQAFDSA